MKDRPVDCPAGCGSRDLQYGSGPLSRGWTPGCVECARRNPDLVAAEMARDVRDLDELRQVLIAAERWFLSIDMTHTCEESDLALALRARNPNLGVNRGIRINDIPTT